LNKTRRQTLLQILNDLTVLQDLLECVKVTEEEAYENLPESIQDSEKGEVMQDAISELDDALSSIESAIESIDNAGGGLL